MQKLKIYDDVVEAEAQAVFLESHGIIAQVMTKHSSSLGVVAFGLIKPSLWVVFDHQYDDALALLENDHHTVETGFSVSEVQAYKDNSAQIGVNFFNQLIAIIALATLGLIALIYFFLL